MDNLNTTLSGIIDSVSVLASKVSDVKASTSGAFTSLEAKRLTNDGKQELNTIDSVSLVANGEVVSKFFAAAETVNATTTFIDNEVATFFDQLGLTPDTYNGFTWNAETNPVSGMTAENGPYLVFCTKTAEDAALPSGLLGMGKFHVKCLKGMFDTAINNAIDTKLAEINTKLESVLTQIAELQEKIETT